MQPEHGLQVPGTHGPKAALQGVHEVAYADARIGLEATIRRVLHRRRGGRPWGNKCQQYQPQNQQHYKLQQYYPQNQQL
eukprot:5459193-Heterocapsa_arctica.AAC.1